MSLIKEIYNKIFHKKKSDAIAEKKVSNLQILNNWIETELKAVITDKSESQSTVSTYYKIAMYDMVAFTIRTSDHYKLKSPHDINIVMTADCMNFIVSVKDSARCIVLTLEEVCRYLINFMIMFDMRYVKFEDFKKIDKYMHQSAYLKNIKFPSAVSCPLKRIRIEYPELQDVNITISMLRKEIERLQKSMNTTVKATENNVNTTVIQEDTVEQHTEPVYEETDTVEDRLWDTASIGAAWKEFAIMHIKNKKWAEENFIVKQNFKTCFINMLKCTLMNHNEICSLLDYSFNMGINVNICMFFFIHMKHLTSPVSYETAINILNDYVEDLRNKTSMSKDAFNDCFMSHIFAGKCKSHDILWNNTLIHKYWTYLKTTYVTDAWGKSIKVPAVKVKTFVHVYEKYTSQEIREVFKYLWESNMMNGNMTFAIFYGMEKYEYDLDCIKYIIDAMSLSDSSITPLLCIDKIYDDYKNFKEHKHMHNDDFNSNTKHISETDKDQTENINDAPKTLYASYEFKGYGNSAVGEEWVDSVEKRAEQYDTLVEKHIMSDVLYYVNMTRVQKQIIREMFLRPGAYFDIITIINDALTKHIGDNGSITRALKKSLKSFGCKSVSHDNENENKGVKEIMLPMYSLAHDDYQFSPFKVCTHLDKHIIDVYWNEFKSRHIQRRHIWTEEVDNDIEKRIKKLYMSEYDVDVVDKVIRDTVISMNYKINTFNELMDTIEHNVYQISDISPNGHIPTLMCDRVVKLFKDRQTNDLELMNIN